MKNMIIGAALGTVAGIALGIAIKTMHERGMLDELIDNIESISAKTKKDVKNLIASGKNEAEYIKERTGDFVDQKKRDVKNVIASGKTEAEYAKERAENFVDQKKEKMEKAMSK